MEKTWMPMTVGILDIVSGGLSFIMLALAAIGVAAFAAIEGIPLPVHMGNTALVLVMLVIMAVPLLIAEVLAILGGIYVLKRKKWGWALTGSIAAIFCSLVLGIAAIVLTMLSKNQFE